ncbi:MAG: glycoside hydrolase family 30 protein, partial [Ginsengibacter sp.]
LNDPEAAKYLWGIGYHWYESWSGGTEMFSNVAMVHEAFPKINLIFTEGCAERFEMANIHEWRLGEKYGTSMIHDFNAGTVAWTDWNILLDETGGPNHVQNFCFAPIHGNTQTGELIYTNAYYYIGHFSKFIKEGAKRIISSPSRSNLLSTSFMNPDGKVVTVVMNKTDEPVKYFLWINGDAVEVNMLARSIQTLVY